MKTQQTRREPNAQATRTITKGNINETTKTKTTTKTKVKL